MIVELARNGITHVCMELFDRLSLRMDRFPDCPSTIAARHVLFDNENQFFHPAPFQPTDAATDPPE